MNERASALPTYDVTARKAHQWTVVALVAVGYLLGGVPGAIPVAVAGAIMLVGRFWWPADLVRQAVWRIFEPAGILQRRDRHEDHETRRIARVLGGAIWLVSAALFATGTLIALAWVLCGAIAVLVTLDAAVDFCALCFFVSQLERRGLLPAALRPGRSVG